ncbi:MAG: peptidoglycan editing factor PgeF [Deltaproteobacteria bacterium]|nr:peptidoglycan editing factor PgeF [Deltaproteobacteria bacterium]
MFFSFQGRVPGFIPSPLFEMKQVHGDRILLLDSPEKFDLLYRTEADAVICTVPQIAIAVRTADCVPILISHPYGIVAAVHAGWRGTKLRILQKTLVQIKEKFNVDLSEIHVVIGPSICEKCYEVGEEVAIAILNEVESLGQEDGLVAKKNGGKYFLNLKLANQLLARAAGVLESQLTVRPECTLCNEEEFYSYRGSNKKQEPSEGRNYSWIKF